MFSNEKRPLADVYVMIRDMDRTEVTDSTGYFSFERVRPGYISIEFSHVGYEPTSLSGIQVRGQEKITVDTVYLNPIIFNTGSVVITASRRLRAIEEIPGSMNLVNVQQIEIRQSRTSAEALREENGIFVQKTNNGGGSAIIRGLSSSQILLLVDGIRLNNSVYRLGNHQYLTTIDPFLADRIEVVRGPASVMYGSDALGGTVNIISARPVFSVSGFRIGGRLSGRYAGADAEKNGRFDLNLGDKNLVLKTGFSYKDYSDLRRGAKGNNENIKTSTNGLIQSPSGYDAWDSDVQLRYGFSPLQQLTLMFQHSRQNNVPRYDKYEFDGYTHWAYDPQIRSLVYVRYEHTFPSGFIENYSITTSWQRQAEGRRIQQNLNAIKERELDDVKTVGFIVQAMGNFNANQLAFGAELYRDHVSSKRIQGAEKQRGRYPDGASYTSLGIFLQDEITLTNRMRVTLGARFSDFFTGFSLPEPALPDEIALHFSALTGSIGSVYRLSENMSGQINIAQGFRAPNLSDLAKLGESKGQVYEVPNPDLNAEKMLSFEAGVELKNHKFLVQAAGYYSEISDLLASSDDTFNGSPVLVLDSIQYKVKSKQNIGRAKIHGIELQFNWQLSRTVSLSGFSTYTYGLNITDRKPVGGIPPLFGRFAVKWQELERYAELLVRFADKQTKLSADDRDDPRIPEGGTPGWTILTIRGGFPLSDFLNINLALENIFDLNYREHGSGINGPGRNFIISMQAKF